MGVFNFHSSGILLLALEQQLEAIGGLLSSAAGQ